MTTKQILLELLSSLKKEEKKAITQAHENKKTPPKYILLYNWLEKQIKKGKESYSRKEFLEQEDYHWKGRALETAETTLYNKILENLSLKYLDKKSITVLNQKIAEAEILKNKGFYDNSLERLKKAEELAKKHHKNALLIEIIPKKIDVILLTKHEGREKQVRAMSEQLLRATTAVQQEAEYRMLNVNLVVQFQKSRDPKKIPLFLKDQYFSLINKGFPSSGSFYSQYYFHSIQAIWANIHREGTKAYKHQSKVVELWEKEEHEEIREENTQSYLTQYANLINYAVVSEDFELAQKDLDLMSKIKTYTKDEKAEKEQNTLFYQQLILLNEHEFEEAKELVPAITALLVPDNQEIAIPKKTLKGNAKRIHEENKRRAIHYKRVNPSRVYNFHYNTLITLLICQDYSEANEWLKRLVNTYKDADPRKDIQQLWRILQLTITYGLESEKFSKRTFNKLYHNKSDEVPETLLPFEQIMHDFFEKMMTGPTMTERKTKHLSILLEDLEALDEKDKKVLGYGDIVLWIKGHFR